MLKNASMPEQCLIPVLGYPDVNEAVKQLGQAFGFTLRWRVGEHRAQLEVGPGSAIAIVQSDPPIRQAADHVMLRVDDVDAHCDRARRSGVQVLAAPADMPYGERQYTARDFSGRLWVFTESIADLRPDVWGGHVGPALG